MFLVVRPIDRKAIAHWERLPRDEQEQLRSRLMRYKNRALVEGRRMEDLAITPSRRDGRLVWNYQGSLFTVESTADEAMTRRLIVRLGQIFTAYRQLFPPRWTAGGRVHIRIFGATAEYHAALAELGLDIKNPAVFLVDKNVILAGSELNRFDAELEAVNRQHRQIKQQLDALVADMPARLKELGETLTKNGVPAGERQKIVAAEQRKWEDQRKAARKKIVVLDRKNAARFDEVAGQMFKRLAHEAFHAYLEVHVYPRQVYDVPRWLNEGLAQTFETGLLEADTLRIDVPNPAALAELQKDLRSDEPLELSELLNAGSDTFLSGHATGAGGFAAVLLFVGAGLVPGFRAGRVRHAAVRRLPEPRRRRPAARRAVRKAGRHAARRIPDSLAQSDARVEGHAVAAAAIVAGLREAGRFRRCPSPPRGRGTARRLVPTSRVRGARSAWRVGSTRRCNP